MQDTFTREEILKRMNEKIDWYLTLYKREKDICYLNMALDVACSLQRLDLITLEERYAASERILAFQAGC